MTPDHANPLMKKAAEHSGALSLSERMTAGGTFRWLGALAMVTMIVGYMTMTRTAADPAAALPVMWLGVIGGFVTAMIILFNPRTAKMLGLVYATLEGLALGGITALYELKAPGVGSTALMSTFGVFGVMFLVYASKLIRPTPGFHKVLLFAVLGVLALYVVDLLAVFFVGGGFSFLHEASPLALGVSLVICGIAAFCLIADFGMMDDMIHAGAPKHMEAYAAVGMLITLVWLYLEILRLVAIVGELFGDD